MQSNTDRIRKEFLPEKREWAKSDGTRLHFLETATGHEPVDFARIMTLWLKA